METRASYVLVGLFSVLAILAGLGFFLWLAKVEISRRFAQYDIIFDDVSGLEQSSAVSYNGVSVGKVLAITLDRTDPSRVNVRIEVAAETPVRSDTVATLESQVVTGVSFVALAGGALNAPPLIRAEGAPLPVIRSELSGVQGLIEDAPDLLSEAIDLLRQLSAFASEENRASFQNILQNVDAATGRLDSVLADLAQVSDRIAAAADEISGFAQSLGPIAAKADDTVAAVNVIVEDRVPQLLDQIDTATAGISSAAKGLEAFSQGGLQQFGTLAEEARLLVRDLQSLTARVSRDPARFLLGNQTPEYTR